MPIELDKSLSIKGKNEKLAEEINKTLSSYLPRGIGI